MPSSGLDTADSSTKLLFGLWVVAENPALFTREDSQNKGSTQTLIMHKFRVHGEMTSANAVSVAERHITEGGYCPVR